MNSLRSRFRIFLFAYLSVLVLGTVIFSVVENVALVDAFYFSIVTIATVGYGDIHPVTNPGKLVTIVLIITGVGTFLGVVANATEIMLSRREMRSRMEKLNMVIEVFFSEAGKTLLAMFSGADPGVDAVSGTLTVRGDWDAATFARMRAGLREHEWRVVIENVDLAGLKALLLGKREFFVRLLENPVLMEHESFTDLLMAVFHLTEELASRDAFEGLPKSDLRHLAGDIERAYGYLALEYLSYMSYLKENYPYLFSLAIRTNPFDRDASVIVR